MKKLILTFILTMGISVSTFAEKLKVITAYPYIASITEEIAGDKVNVQSLASGKYDPHFIVPRPSYIAKLRNADLLIVNGGQLEVGWIPPLVSQANNSKIVGNGTLDLSYYVKLQEVPHDVNRIFGDVHPAGNPHFAIDPYNIYPIAQAIADRLSKLDAANADSYKAGLEKFIKKWNDHMETWNKSMNSLKGVSVVQYHDLYHYLLSRYQIKSAGTLEVLPGIPPTIMHTMEIEKIIPEQSVKLILQDTYHSKDEAEMLSKKFHIRLIVLPHDVGATAHTENIFALFDEIVRLMTHD